MTRLMFLILICLWPALGVAKDRDVVIFAAASLKNVLDATVQTFEAETGMGVAVSYGGSSALARQIQQGAPADIFISANEAWMNALETDRLIRTESRVVLAGNGLVLIGTEGPPVDPGDADALLARLAPDAKLAMALVAAVPAGIYGKAAFQSLGSWDSVAPHVAQTDNVRAALRLVTLGEARLGVVYATDAQSDGDVMTLGVFPATSHPPIRYPAAITAESRHPYAARVLAFLTGTTAQQLFAQYGFLPVPAQ